MPRPERRGRAQGDETAEGASTGRREEGTAGARPSRGGVGRFRCADSMASASRTSARPLTILAVQEGPPRTRSQLAAPFLLTDLFHG